MEKKVYRVGATWEHIEDPDEIAEEHYRFSEEYDEIAYVAITDACTMQVCVIRKGNKYGIYSLDHVSYFGGPGTRVTPTICPFPYDEVKCCTYVSFYKEYREYGYFAFRINDKWGIIKIHGGNEYEEGAYDVEYGDSRRKIIAPCQYSLLADAERQLGEACKWEDPFNSSESAYGVKLSQC